MAQPTGHNTAFIAKNTAAGIQFGTNGSVLVGIMNQSVNQQSSPVSIYDGPSVAAVLANPTAFNLIYQPVLGGGQILDVTILNAGIRFNQGVVAIPNGAMNADGGLTFLYD